MDEFVNVPYHKKPYFLKTETQLSSSNLYSKFSATTAKGLVSFHALCALNIYLGGSKDISKLAYGEFSKSSTYQALSEENDEIFLSFDQAINLAHSIVYTLVDITREESRSISEISEQINEKLDTNFEAVESPAMEIQLGVEPEQLDEPIQASTPLTEKEIRAFHDKEKVDYLKKTLKLHAVDLESAAEVADSENEKLFQEIINPTPGLTLDDQMNVDEQFSYRDDPNQYYALPSPLKTRLDSILQEAREKINSIAFPSPAIEEIPSNTYPPSEITTEDIYIDDSLRELAKPIYFPQPSTDDRRDFEIGIGENEMILFKSPSLTIASVYKKELRNILNKIIADLDLNLTETLMSASDIQDTKQKKLILKQSIKRLNKAPKKDIEKQLESHDWLQKLIDDQIKVNNIYFSLGQYDNDSQKNKCKNVAKRKKRPSPLTSDDRLEEMPSIYSLVPANKIKKVESAKNIFSNIIKNIPPEDYKKFKIEYDQSNDISISEINSDDREFVRRAYKKSKQFI